MNGWPDPTPEGVVLADIGRGDEIIVRDRDRNLLVGPACFSKTGDLCVRAFGQPITVARQNRNGKLTYLVAGMRVVGHQPPLGLFE